MAIPRLTEPHEVKDHLPVQHDVFYWQCKPEAGVLCVPIVLGTIDVESTSKQRWYLVCLALDSKVAMAANCSFDNAFTHAHGYEG